MFAAVLSDSCALEGGLLHLLAPSVAVCQYGLIIPPLLCRCILLSLPSSSFGLAPPSPSLHCFFQDGSHPFIEQALRHFCRHFPREQWPPELSLQSAPSETSPAVPAIGECCPPVLLCGPDGSAPLQPTNLVVLAVQVSTAISALWQALLAAHSSPALSPPLHHFEDGLVADTNASWCLSLPLQKKWLPVLKGPMPS